MACNDRHEDTTADVAASLGCRSSAFVEPVSGMQLRFRGC